MKNRISSFVVILAIINLFIPSISFSQPKSLGIFERQNDIGKVNKPGSATYDAEKQEYTIKGSGANMWFDHDEFHFVWKRMRGDFILTTRVQFIGEGVEEHRKIGWMVRSSLDSDATHINAAVHGEGLTSLQFRRGKGGLTEEVRSSLRGAGVIQLERKGDTYTMSVARFGGAFITQQVSDLTLGNEVYAGLYVCSHNEGVVEQAVFRDARITVPAKEDFVPYIAYVYGGQGTINVPSWSPDIRRVAFVSNTDMR